MPRLRKKPEVHSGTRKTFPVYSQYFKAISCRAPSPSLLPMVRWRRRSTLLHAINRIPIPPKPTASWQMTHDLQMCQEVGD